VLLLNNCTDDSFAAALASARALGLRGVVVDLALPGADAHVGWARRFAMDIAAHRLAASQAPRPAILTTDADSLVAPERLAGLATRPQQHVVAAFQLHLFEHGEHTIEDGHSPRLA
jgi:hypothetical protein